MKLNLAFVALSLLCVASISSTFAAQAQASDKTAMNEKINKLLSEMTLEEKIGQLTQYSADMDITGDVGNVPPAYKEEIVKGHVGSVFNAFTPSFTREIQKLAVEKSPHGIPLLIAYDVIHGHKTIFPIPLAESSSWNIPMIQKTARISAREATADGIHWIFAPMVDIARDPRWGRISEGAGEDPYLGSKIAAARVKGIQGNDLRNVDSALAGVKHFAAYGAAQGGRDYNVVSMGEQELFDTYLPPYKAAVDAGVATLMTAFNEINGVPSTANKKLITEVLRGLWNFKGFVVSDYTSINELVPHGVAATSLDAAHLAFDAGVDMDMQGGLYFKHLPELIRQGKVSEEALNLSVRRILEAKFALGLFDNPYKNCDEERAQKVLMAPEHLEHARDIARRSIVLLKNDKQTLPLKAGKTIALIGPQAANKRDPLGNWSAAGKAVYVKSLKEGMEEFALENSQSLKILYAKGSPPVDTDNLNYIRFLNTHQQPEKLDMGVDVDSFKDDALLKQALKNEEEKNLKEALEVASKADVIVLSIGETQGMTGEAASKTKIEIPQNQKRLLRKLKELQKPLVLVLSNGRPLVLEEESQLADALVESWFLGTQSGLAIADVLFGKYNPSGKLTVSFPYNEGQIPVNYGQKITGRPASGDPREKYSSRYQDAPNEALYPFGWGLSYTQFSYSNLKLDSQILKADAPLKLSVDVSNTGAFDGEETVQLYLRQLVGSITRPSLQLKNFKKVFLKKGETKTLRFEISEEDLKFYNLDLKYVAEEGNFKAFVGSNSKDLLGADFKYTAH